MGAELTYNYLARFINSFLFFFMLFFCLLPSTSSFHNALHLCSNPANHKNPHIEDWKLNVNVIDRRMTKPRSRRWRRLCAMMRRKQKRRLWRWKAKMKTRWHEHHATIVELTFATHCQVSHSFRQRRFVIISLIFRCTFNMQSVF